MADRDLQALSRAAALDPSLAGRLERARQRADVAPPERDPRWDPQPGDVVREPEPKPRAWMRVPAPVIRERRVVRVWEDGEVTHTDHGGAGLRDEEETWPLETWRSRVSGDGWTVVRSGPEAAPERRWLSAFVGQARKRRAWMAPERTLHLVRPDGRTACGRERDPDEADGQWGWASSVDCYRCQATLRRLSQERRWRRWWEQVVEAAEARGLPYPLPDWRAT